MHKCTDACSLSLTTSHSLLHTRAVAPEYTDGKYCINFLTVCVEAREKKYGNMYGAPIRTTARAICGTHTQRRLFMHAKGFGLEFESLKCIISSEICLYWHY